MAKSKTRRRWWQWRRFHPLCQDKHSNHNDEPFTTFQQQFARNLLAVLTYETGIDNVTRRMCRLASGLDPNTRHTSSSNTGNNTTTPTQMAFRPFSARDSHVVAQLKRSADGACRLHRLSSITDGTHEENRKKKGSRYTKLIFDAALQASKAARSTKTIPPLHALRSLEEKSNLERQQITQQCIASVEELAVEPIVRTCVGRWRVMMKMIRHGKDYGEGGGGIRSKIVELREGASKRIGLSSLAMAEGNSNDEKVRAIKQLLHHPTMELREGKNVNLEEVWDWIEKEMVVTTVGSGHDGGDV